MSEYPMSDRYMPMGWHQVKMALLSEIAASDNFHAIGLAADALSHARRMAEKLTTDMASTFSQQVESSCNVEGRRG